MEKRTQNSYRIVASIFLATCSLFACKSTGVRAVEPTASPTPAETSGEKVTQTPVDYVGVKADTDAFDLSLSSQKAKDGSLIELRLRPIQPVDPDTIHVSFEGQEFPIFEGESATSFVALIVVPFNSKPRDSKIELTWKPKGSAEKKSSSLPLAVIDGNYRSEVLKVQEEKINPPKRVVKRIMAEQKEIGKLYKEISKTRYWAGPFALPIESEMTSPFGNKRLYNGSMKSFHQGLDLRARTPTPIHAPEGAKVAMAKDLYFTGNTVILDHGYGLFTIYGHMSKLGVKKGEVVKKGQVLGLSGATGRASGPHLHWGAVLMHQKFNPQDLIQVLR